MKSQNPIALDQNTNVIPIHFGKATIPSHLKNMLIQGDRNGVRLVFALSFPCEDAIILESTRAEIFALLPNGDELKKELPIFQNQNSVYATWIIDENFTKYAGTLSPQLNVYMGESIFKQIKMDSLDIEKPLSSKDFIVSEYPNVLQNLLDDLKITKENLAENYYTKKQIDDFNFGSGGSGGSGANGKDGKSAYEIWLSLGNIGSEQDFISSLVGANGVDGTDGVEGKSAYQTWLSLGNIGTQQDFISSLVGANGVDGTDGESAYETWLNLGNIGTQEDFINSLKCIEENPFNPDLFYTKQETHQQLKVVENKISNDNLIMNADFKIWQRGESFIAPNNKYTSDRWRCNGSGSVYKTIDGMKIDGRINIKYTMEDCDYTAIKNKVCTLSYCKNNVIISNCFTINNATVVNLDLVDCTVNWIKLEIGSDATQFTPKPYVQELQNVQRYYFNINESFYNTAFTMTAVSSNNLLGSILFPVPMRALPTISFKEQPCFRSNNTGKTLYKPLSFNTQHGRYGINAIHNVVFSSDHFVQNNIYTIIFEADAEIYN